MKNAPVLIATAVLIGSLTPAASEPTAEQIEQLQLASMLHGIADMCRRRYDEDDLYQAAKRHILDIANSIGDVQITEFLTEAIETIEADENRELPSEEIVGKEACAKVRSELSNHPPEAE